MSLNKKYEPLKIYLMNCDTETVELSYDQIEQIIDDFLPGSASNYMEWWANGEHAQANAWLQAGWKVSEIKLGKSIVFAKENPRPYLEIQEEPGREEIEAFLDNKDDIEISSKKQSSINIYFLLSGIVFLMFIFAAVLVGKSGLEIGQIESVGGRTLEEMYYTELGNIYLAYAIVIAALGIFFSSVLVWVGTKNIKERTTK